MSRVGIVEQGVLLKVRVQSATVHQAATQWRTTVATAHTSQPIQAGTADAQAAAVQVFGRLGLSLLAHQREYESDQQRCDAGGNEAEQREQSAGQFEKATRSAALLLRLIVAGGAV